MAYNEKLNDRIREAMASLKKVEEKYMFGGVCYMLNGKMCVGVVKDELMCRIDPEIHEASIKRKGCRTMDFTKKPMRGYIFVDSSGLGSEKELAYWIGLAVDFNARAKSSKKKK